MKNLIEKYIKFKRCNTIEEAKERRKNRLILFLISLALFVVGCLNLYSTGALQTILGIVLVIGIICCCITLPSLVKAHNEVDRLNFVLCKKCGKEFKFDNVNYKLVNERKSTKTDNNGNINYTIWKRFAFNCTCDACGETKYFEYDFEAERGTSKANGVVLKTSPIDYEQNIRNFFAK